MKYGNDRSRDLRVKEMKDLNETMIPSESNRTMVIQEESKKDRIYSTIVNANVPNL